MDSKLIGFKENTTLPTKVYNEVRCSSGSVPDLSLEIAQQTLEADETLSDWTTVPIDNITSLLSICLGATYFYQGSVYQQIYGMAMGLPVSVLIATLVMEYVKTEHISGGKSAFGSDMWMMFAAQ